MKYRLNAATAISEVPQLQDSVIGKAFPDVHTHTHK